MASFNFGINDAALQAARDIAQAQLPVTASELTRRMKDMGLADYLRTPGHRSWYGTDWHPSFFNETTMAPHRDKMMLHLRLNLPEGSTLPFDFCEVAPRKEGGPVLFILHRDQPLVLEDPAPELFPSDQLIARLRLLI
jgi:hypothetical protein